jgi:uncharacterized damage-inducible protein DinB
LKETREIIQRLSEVFAGEPWYGTSLMGVLETIPYGLILTQCEPSGNSIARLVRHMLNWREFAIKKLEGDKVFDIELNTEADWTDLNIKNESEWRELCAQFGKSQEKIIRLMMEKSDGHLTEKVPGKLYDFRFLIEGLIQHDIYHLGQIALIHRLLKQL